jgi:GR25 family glycosyltransferase involved in LPS biosynthesis
MIDHAYCINLERSKERRASAQNQFESHGLEVEMFNATDGKLEAPSKLFITKSEWGCAMSHVRVWRDIVENGYETSLIFEDDVVLSPNFVEKLEQVMSELPDDWDFLNIGAPELYRINMYDHSENLKEGMSVMFHAYLIRLKCAKKWSLIEPDHLKIAIDTFAYNYPSYNLHVNEPIAGQVSPFNSTIGALRTHDYTFYIRNLAPIIILLLIVCYIVWRFLLH